MWNKILIFINLITHLKKKINKVSFIFSSKFICKLSGLSIIL